MIPLLEEMEKEICGRKYKLSQATIGIEPPIFIMSKTSSSIIELTKEKGQLILSEWIEKISDKNS